MAEKVVITVLGKDRVGIVAEISGVLYQNNVNILDINQKVMGEEIFAMTMLVDISLSKVSFAELKEQLEKKGEEMELKVMAQHEDIFKFMHRI